MPRNLVICCDGTNNQFGVQNTNVVRTIQIVHRDPTKQRVYYDPGVGTLPEPGALTWLGKKVSTWWGLAFGTGLTRDVEEAYCYLMDLWEPGDQVFLFGFSRGAYTVRVLAGLLHTLGLAPRGSTNLVPYILRLFAAIREEGAAETGHGTSQYWRLCDEFRWTFARPTPQSGDDRRFRVHFLGVWDTVSSVGYVWNPARYPFTKCNPSIDIVRHAVAIDERRWFFRQNLLERAGQQDFQELWFPGVHSDVGGGYPETEGGLWRMPFEWMVGEAEQAGLLIDSARRETVLSRTAPSQRPWTDRQNESLVWKWWPAEFFPKLVWHRSSGQRRPQIGRGRHRYIQEKAVLHKATLLRIRDAPYAPPNLSTAFLAYVRNLPDVPETLAYAIPGKD